MAVPGGGIPGLGQPLPTLGATGLSQAIFREAIKEGVSFLGTLIKEADDAARYLGTLMAEAIRSTGLAEPAPPFVGTVAEPGGGKIDFLPSVTPEGQRVVITSPSGKKVGGRLARPGRFDIAGAFGALAANLERATSLFSLVDAVTDAIIREDILYAEDVTFEEILEYENFLGGMNTVLIIISGLFAVSAELVSFGQVKGPLGLMLHILDETIGGAQAIIQRGIYRKAISELLDTGFARVHRVKNISSSEASEAYAEGLITAEEAREAHAQDGFHDRAVAVKMQLAEVKLLRNQGREPVRVKTLSVAQIITATKNATIDEDEAAMRLGRLGLDDDSITILLESELHAPKAKQTGP